MNIDSLKNLIYRFFFYIYTSITFCFLLLQINLELDKTFYPNFEQIILDKNTYLKDIKSFSNIGWFNLDEEYDYYEKGADIYYISFQNMIAPTILENYSYNKKIICYYTSPIQLAAFCKKNKKYRLIRKNIFTNFALLERID